MSGEVVGELASGEGGIKLVDQRRDDAGPPALDQPPQIGPAGCLAGFQAAAMEGVADLLVQVHAVGDKDDAGVLDLRRKRNGVRQHHHGQGFPTALRVPDETALRRAPSAFLCSRRAIASSTA